MRLINGSFLNWVTPQFNYHGDMKYKSEEKIGTIQSYILVQRIKRVLLVNIDVLDNMVLGAKTL